MYTKEQKLKDVDEAIKAVSQLQEMGASAYLCGISARISYNFNSFFKRYLLKIKKISPKSYSKAIIKIEKFKTSSYYPVWSPFDYESRLQFLNDLREYIKQQN